MGSTAKIPVYDGSRENKIVLFCLSFSGSEASPGSLLHRISSPPESDELDACVAAGSAVVAPGIGGIVTGVSVVV